ncbi:hypothetical protein PBCVNY2B_506L [Paramecium bursaria Chlorella virus NY2B]|uniref:hypothetical protein n=1 Tax=Paramecium bursaria Chlorella virus AR158 TaxID=380598 RepID=UPI00015AA6E1|nr:hypothetical protein AR158_C447L [Paramecium bursaria Chlorella virus AR158]ABU43992.1 hypothetical protein AR158_C447L [Paramecium bursaria Chlorella virus AR158]AGE54265.1 hypothetical protein PBCVIL52s1_526L [Paramecium bursaria Chlorella virus IL-5-2s1]AGE58380.1 hypothetical protein PBCVNY2B_506L [Paramecium bursaria Chlorella virus NY2B]
MVEPSPGPLSLHFGKMNNDKSEEQELGMIDENDMSILTNSFEEDENNLEEENEITLEETEIKSELKLDKSLDTVPVERLSEATPTDGKNEDENSLEYKDEIIISDSLEQKNTSSTTTEHFIKECDRDEQEVLYFTDVNPVSLADDFLEMKKQGGVYFVPFKKPLVVQTPVFKLTESATGGSVTLKITRGFSAFVKEIEQMILNAAFVNKSSWFRTELTNEIITEGFKSFMNELDLKVKVSEELTSFDEEGNYIENNFKTPVGVRCILEMTGVCFGKLEFGSMFTLTQIQTTKIPKCVIHTSREKRDNFSEDFV